MRRLTLSLLLLLVLAAPAAAHASYSDLLSDCADDEQIQGHYSAGDYANALKHMPSDAKEYTGCYDVIQQAQRAAAAGTGSGSGSGGTTSGGTTSSGTSSNGTGVDGGTIPNGVNPIDKAGAADKAAAKAAQAQGGQGLKVGNSATITPGDPGEAAASLDALPTPLLVLLGVLVVAAFAGLGLFVKTRVFGRSSST